MANKQKTIAALKAVRGNGVAWLLSHLNADGSLGDPTEGFHFYRAPWTFAIVGETGTAAVGEVFNMGGREPHCAEAFVDFQAVRLELPHIKACVPTARRPWYIASGKAERLLGYEARYTVYDMVDDAIQTRETPV